MHVASRPIEAPVVLVERATATGCQRILVFRDGLLAPSVLALLGRLLEKVV